MCSENLNATAGTESAIGFARLWILPGACREPSRPAQMVVMETVTLAKGWEGMLYSLSSGQQSSGRREEKQELRCCWSVCFSPSELQYLLHLNGHFWGLAWFFLACLLAHTCPPFHLNVLLRL